MSAEEWLRARGIEPAARRGPPAGGGDIAREPTQAIPVIAALPAATPSADQTPPESGNDLTTIPTQLLMGDDAEVEAALAMSLRDVSQDDDVEDLSTVMLPIVPNDVTRLPTHRLHP